MFWLDPKSPPLLAVLATLGIGVSQTQAAGPRDYDGPSDWRGDDATSEDTPGEETPGAETTPAEPPVAAELCDDGRDFRSADVEADDEVLAVSCHGLSWCSVLLIRIA